MTQQPLAPVVEHLNTDVLGKATGIKAIIGQGGEQSHTRTTTRAVHPARWVALDESRLAADLMAESILFDVASKGVEMK